MTAPYLLNTDGSTTFVDPMVVVGDKKVLTDEGDWQPFEVGVTTLVVADTSNGHTADAVDPHYASPYVTTASTTWMVPPGVTSVTFTLQASYGVQPSGGAAGGVGHQLTGTLNLTSAGIDPGEVLHITFDAGAAGGPTGAGLGPGGAGGTSVSIRTASGKSATVAMAAGGGGGSVGAGGTNLTLDTQAQTASDPTAGASGGALSRGGGGGGAGWRGGTGGSSGNGGNAGTAMYHSTHVTDQVLTANTPGGVQATLTWSAADSPTLAPADVAHGHIADDVSLTQVHTLSGLADAVHSHAVEAVSLTQVHILVVADAMHGHEVEAFALTQLHILAADDPLHSHASENIVLTQGHVLAGVSDAFHDHSTDAISLTQVHTISGLSDAFHDHTADTTLVKPVTVMVLYADAHITGTIPSPSGALDEPDDTWTGDTGSSWDSRFSMEDVPVGAVLDGIQVVTVQARQGSAGTGTPTITVELWENGVYVKDLVVEEAVLV